MKPLNKMDEQFYVLSDEEMATVEGGGILVGIVIVGGSKKLRNFIVCSLYR